MNESVMLYILVIIIFLLLLICCSMYVSKKNLLKRMQEMNHQVTRIMEMDTDEKVMIFTDEKVLVKLVEEINGILESRQRAKADYRKSELASKRMLSNISHDIKTPLTVILGYLEIMNLNSNENKEMLKKVENKAKQVMELINAFFSLAKIEAGDIEIELFRINISELCRQNIADFYEILTEKEFEVQVNIPKKDIFVYGNEEALNRILFNLISNSLRYGSDGKYLGFTIRYEENEVFIDVIDKGKGIEKSMAEHVFERLYTMDDSRNRQIQGSGLGLTIAKSLVEKLGGDITLESSTYEKTVFTIKLKSIKYWELSSKEICKNYSRVLKK